MCVSLFLVCRVYKQKLGGSGRGRGRGRGREGEDGEGDRVEERVVKLTQTYVHFIGLGEYPV